MYREIIAAVKSSANGTPFRLLGDVSINLPVVKSSLHGAGPPVLLVPTRVLVRTRIVFTVRTNWNERDISSVFVVYRTRARTRRIHRQKQSFPASIVYHRERLCRVTILCRFRLPSGSTRRDHPSIRPILVGQYATVVTVNTAKP